MNFVDKDGTTVHPWDVTEDSLLGPPHLVGYLTGDMLLLDFKV